MKNILLDIFYIGILLVVASCSPSSPSGYSRYGVFPETDEVTVGETALDSVYFRYPYRVEIGNGLAVLLDLHNDSHNLYAFTYPDWQPVAPFGKRGEGPEELLSADRVRLCAPDSVWVLDANRMQITRWSVDVANRQVSRVETVSLDKRLLRTLDFCKTANGFLVDDYTGEHRFHEIGIDGRIIRSMGTVPTEDEGKRENPMALAQAWRSFMDYDPQGGTLAIATQLGEVLEIHNLKTGFHTVLYGPGGEPVFSSQGNEAFPKGIKGYNDVQVTNKHIYVTFDGIAFKEKYRQYETGEKGLEGGRYLYVFDLQGNPVRSFHLNRSVFGLSVNEKDGIVTCTTTDMDKPIVTLNL